MRFFLIATFLLHPERKKHVAQISATKEALGIREASYPQRDNRTERSTKSAPDGSAREDASKVADSSTASPEHANRYNPCSRDQELDGIPRDNTFATLELRSLHLNHLPLMIASQCTETSKIQLSVRRRIRRLLWHCRRRIRRLLWQCWALLSS